MRTDGTTVDAELLLDTVNRAAATRAPDGRSRWRRPCSAGHQIGRDLAGRPRARREGALHRPRRPAFLHRHRARLASNPRMRQAVAGLDRLRDLDEVLRQEERRGDTPP